MYLGVPPLENATTNVDGMGSSETETLKGGECLRVRITNKLWCLLGSRDLVQLHEGIRNE